MLLSGLRRLVSASRPVNNQATWQVEGDLLERFLTAIRSHGSGHEEDAVELAVRVLHAGIAGPRSLFATLGRDHPLGA